MKQILLIFILTLSFLITVTAKECQDFYSEEKLASAYKLGEEVSITDQKWDLIFWQNTSLKKEELTIEVEEISGFSCQVQLKKTTDQCLIMRLIWSAGYDINGCFFMLKDRAGNDLGHSSIFIGY